jgi:hypothetical protein
MTYCANCGVNIDSKYCSCGRVRTVCEECDHGCCACGAHQPKETNISLGGFFDYATWPDQARFEELDIAIARQVERSRGGVPLARQQDINARRKAYLERVPA